MSSAVAAWEHEKRDSVREAAWLAQLSSDGLAVEPRHDAAPPTFLVASLDPSSGDPQLVTVYPDVSADGVRVDRRTMRAQQLPEGVDVDEQAVMRAADLGDRAQLCLGEPVWLSLESARERFVITGIRPLTPRFSFTNASYRRTAPLMASPGTLAPLSIDALERALKLEGDGGEEPRIRRLFGQAYRRIDEHHTPWTIRPESQTPARALTKLARLGRDVTLALTDAQRFRRTMSRRAPELDAAPLSTLDTEDMLDALRERMALVVEALALLERSRLATLSLLPAVEVTVGGVPREVFSALAAPSRTKERRAVDERLLGLADALLAAQGSLSTPTDPALLQRWSQTLHALRSVRILGMDVRPSTIGSDDAHLSMALSEAVAARHDDAEGKRREAERSLLSLAAKGPLGLLAIGPAGAQITLLSRLSTAKGAVAEGLAMALVRLRAAALEAGRRLVHEGLLDTPDDALYMPLDELEQALEGELGAYAARVRLRREDDRRFRAFDPPRRIVGRKP